MLQRIKTLLLIRYLSYLLLSSSEKITRVIIRTISRKGLHKIYNYKANKNESLSNVLSSIFFEQIGLQNQIIRSKNLLGVLNFFEITFLFNDYQRIYLFVLHTRGSWPYYLKNKNALYYTHLPSVLSAIQVLTLLQ